MQVPQQRDGWSCGLHMLRFMEHWTGKELSPQFHGMDTCTTFRAKLASTLINSSMNEVINIQEDIRRIQTEQMQQKKDE
uniref:Ubiquitin-like protease family profile domain-containing protein n=1 Tax=Oryza rufipogon TaxID=4529 RepID=A0A0E0QM91_ORYRU